MHRKNASTFVLCKESKSGKGRRKELLSDSRKEEDIVYKTISAPKSKYYVLSKPNQMAILNLFLKILEHNPVNQLDLQNLEFDDYVIIKSIIARKYKIEIPQEQFTNLGELACLLNSLETNQKSERRAEECLKLFFKRALKYLIRSKRESDENTNIANLRERKYNILKQV